MSMKLKLNKEDFKDKIMGCWIGKNIGGTLGGPFEHKHDPNNVTGFTTQKGEPLPNDDLDLQLVWLRAMKDVGPKALDSNALADHWLSYIAPNWNEYGIGKSNLYMGLLPPMSGEYNNFWKHSNGAWIRSEIWACFSAGIPNVAVKYAIMDATVDHGFGEGTYAEIFTASMQSMAFFESDIRKLIENALKYIPEDCRVARSIKIVLDSYDKGLSWLEARERVVKDNLDLGWFQAPGNVAFAVIGLVYGEGDFKQSLLYAVNCGDDTDCTCATCGAVLGIIYGAKALPEDWKEYIGDRIINMCVNGSYSNVIPLSCTELTEDVLKLVPSVLETYGVEVEYVEGESSMDEVDADSILSGYSDKVLSRSPYSFEINSLLHTSAVVEYEKEPHIRPNEQFKVKVTLENIRKDPYYYEINVALPEGWTAEYNKTVHVFEPTEYVKGVTKFEILITAGERVETINRIPVMISPKSHAVPVMLPLVLLG